MRRLQSRVTPRLVAVLLILRVLAGLTLCQAWEGSAGLDAAEAAQENARLPESDEGGADQHHHADGGHYECPEMFLAPGCHAMPRLAGQGQIQGARTDGAPSPDYDIPPPIPIV